MFFPVFCNNFFHYNEDLLHLRSLPMKSSFGATIFILWHICIIHFYATFLLKKAENQDNLQLHIFIFNTYWNKVQVPYTALKHKCPPPPPPLLLVCTYAVLNRQGPSGLQFVSAPLLHALYPSLSHPQVLLKCSLVVEYRFNWGSGKTLSSKIFSKVIFTEAVVVGDLCWAVDSDCITYVLQQGPYF